MERALLAQAATFRERELVGIANLTVVPANIEGLRSSHILSAAKRLRTPTNWVSLERGCCADTLTLRSFAVCSIKHLVTPEMRNIKTITVSLPSRAIAQ